MMTKKKKIAMIILGLIFIVGCADFGYYESHYTLNGVVVAVTDEEVVAKANNKEWGFYTDSDSDLQIGDNVKLIMHTNYTIDTNADDMVVGVK